MSEREGPVAGVDVGAECVKAIVMDPDRKVLGRAIISTRGYFEHRVKEAMDMALEEAGVASGDLDALCATGFGSNRVPGATMTAGEPLCHSLGAFHYHPEAMSVVDIGGRDPKVLTVDADGVNTDCRTVRRCAVGIGTFLIFAARHLDVHPTRLQELAADAEEVAHVGSYCSVFAGSEVLERLRDGVPREDVALGCMHSVADRIYEIGGFTDPIRITGGVAEYFPGVLKALAEKTGMSVEPVPEPIMAGAVGASLRALGVHAVAAEV